MKVCLSFVELLVWWKGWAFEIDVRYTVRCLNMMMMISVSA
jgi:hypothetical protein